MILLDTNVISELLRPLPDTRVTAWIQAYPYEALHLSVISVAEIRVGMAYLPAGKRKADFQQQFEYRVLPQFAGRIHPFDLACTPIYAEILATARTRGKAIAVADGYIAAIAKYHHMSVATRDVSPFLSAGIEVINPWGDEQ